MLQGAAAGVLQPLAMVALFRVFPVDQRGRAMSLYGFGVVLAPAVGPALGGALVDAFGWRSIFLLPVPFGVVGLLLGRIALRDARGATRGHLLLPPGIALAMAIAAGGRLADRAEPRYVIAVGLALFALSSLLLAFAGGATAFWLLATWLVIGRVGLGMLIPALNVGAVASLAGTELAYASSSVNFVRQLGGAAGVNLLAVVLEWRLGTYGPAAAARAFHECFALVTCAFAVAIIPAWFHT